MRLIIVDFIISFGTNSEDILVTTFKHLNEVKNDKFWK
jgi:hypothetical protein